MELLRTSVSSVKTLQKNVGRKEAWGMNGLV